MSVAGSAAPAPIVGRRQLRPLRSRWWLVVLLPVVGLGAALFWGFAASTAVDGIAADFARTSVPGQLTVSPPTPSTYYIYVEGVDAATLAELAVRVTGPNGESVPVTATSRGLVAYDNHGMMGHAVGQFRVSQGGTYTVAATGSLTPYGNFAVGDTSVSAWLTPHFWGMAVLLVICLGGAVAIAVVPIVRARRQRRTA